MDIFNISITNKHDYTTIFRILQKLSKVNS
uniref:Uncharacterized protein n=1 Tax=Anguilla anguilla TaxID=7936 RepID=A0A0E9PQ41_ANGAN